jgi:hypothetical protein
VKASRATTVCEGLVVRFEDVEKDIVAADPQHEPVGVQRFEAGRHSHVPCGPLITSGSRRCSVRVIQVRSATADRAIAVT